MAPFVIHPIGDGIHRAFNEPLVVYPGHPPETLKLVRMNDQDLFKG